MKKTHITYQNFGRYCLRTPLFPVFFYHNLTNGKTITVAMLIEIWENKVVQEALFLASPNLFSEIDKLLKHKITDSTKKEKITLSFLKYISRMSTRCTPFGLFAGCSIGSFAAETAIRLTNYQSFYRKTRFDMNFLVALALDLANKPTIKKQLLFYPNSSMYSAGTHLRYIEYTYLKNKRLHSIEGVSNTDYLQSVLDAAYSGKKIEDLALLLVSDSITMVEALVFIEELVANQILVSSLEPSVSGADVLTQIIACLENLVDTKAITALLKGFAKQLNSLDNKLGNDSTVYFDFITRLKKIAIPFETKYLFQTDLFVNATTNTIAETTVANVKKGLVLLNKMTIPNKQNNLSNFRQAFVKRYEQQEVPLALALDIEMGIGYIQTRHIADDNPILDDLRIVPKKDTEHSKYWNNTQAILHKKLQGGHKKDAYCITLSDSDFKANNVDWSDLPNTMSTIAEVVLVGGKEMVYLDSVGGSSAANLLGRFASGNTAILMHSKPIIAKEKELQADKILAEIVHLPQARTGNVLMRPRFRDYEIPFLSKSTLAKEQQIAITDLLISVRGNRIILRSNKYNKVVLPHLTNAHNYSKGLPIYHFLCDMQTQNLRSSLYFSWGNASINYSFTPRVVYENVIFAKATWIITNEVILPFVGVTDTDALLAAVHKWRLNLKMPSYVELVESDNTLLINLENATCIAMLLDSVKGKKQFLLKEFLFADASVVSSDAGDYTNQVVFSFFKDEV